MKKLIFVSLLFLCCHIVVAQASRTSLAARYISIGACSKNNTDVFSGAVNQAALAQVSHPAAGVYGERRFMLKELSSYVACVVMPFKKGGLGLATRYFGSQFYNNTQVGIGYGRTLHPAVDIGVQFNYNKTALAGYGSDGGINAEAGVLLHLTKQLHMGLHVYNIAGRKYGQFKDENDAAIYSTALGYEASDKFFITAEIAKEENKPVTINTGMQYNVSRQLFARMGVASNTGSYFLGFGVQWKSFRIDVNSGWQAQLGFTPGIMLVFSKPPLNTTDN